MGDTAMYLTMHDHRVHRAPDVIYRGVTCDRHRTRIRIDLDFADMAAIGERGQVHRLIAYAIQATQVVRQVVALHGGGCNVEDADRAIRSRDDEAAG